MEFNTVTPRLTSNIYVLCWKDSASLFFPSGKTVQVSCNHIKDGDYYVNMRGDIFPIPETTVPPVVGTGTQDQQQTVLVQAGGVYGPNSSPFPPAGGDAKACVRVKDMVTGITLYLDADDYAVKIKGCNPVAYATGCGNVTSLSAGTPGATSATVTFVDAPGSAAVEYINNTSATTPVIHGTMLPYGTQTVTITGLTTATAYYFWIRTVCPGGVQGSWINVAYTTA